MAPVKKRARRDAAAVKENAAEAETNPKETKQTPTSTSGASVPSLPDLQLLMKRMLNQVQEQPSESSSSSPSTPSMQVQAIQNDLLTLKDWQRSLLEQTDKTETALSTETVRSEKRERALAALHYERAHLQGLIEKCQTYATPNLLQLATDELQLPLSRDTAGTTGTSTSTTNTTQMANDMTAAQKQDAYKQFLGVDVNDPTKKQAIIARLHQELNRRGTLARDVKLKRQELNKIKAELANKRQLLDTLPDQLSVMERASKPLQKFFGLQQNSNGDGNGSSSSVSHMIGTERRARLDLARSLPAPLYTLFQQLQQYVDQSSHLTSHAGAVTVSIVGDKETPAEQQVLLQLPVLDVSSTSSLSSSPTSASTSQSSTSAVRHKRVTIHFHCYTQPTLHITAVASGCGSTLNQDVLLDELFPHDSPQQVSGGGADAVQGRAYHWCNYMAGLHLVDRDCLPSSTRVIVRELQRRIRANAALKYVLQSLQRKTLPTPPGVDKTVTGVKLVSFCLSKNKDNSCESQQTYICSLRKGPANLKVTVQIHSSRYPAVPPVWSLNTNSDDDGSNGTDGDSSSGNNPSLLYDDRLVLLERQVNVEALDKSVILDQEESYDWILVHQLRQVMQEWEGWLDADNANSSSSTNNNASENASRKRKGRDRAPVTTSS
jgi:hypothetical protein